MFAEEEFLDIADYSIQSAVYKNMIAKLGQKSLGENFYA